ncbi:DUF6527 family protein [Roseateles sp. NT4]|uniref:DUF6527 family protein n=1 Tax=Roseateles sp. NT4 TaxID=3453715 RepID=UPI003EEA0B3E
MKQRQFSPQFVEYLPDNLEEGVLYVSMPYAVAAHRCACGCKKEVVTPLSPTDWKLIFDGENVSLDPSIGNWSFPCRSHYFIRGGRVQWAADMSDAAVQRGRLRDRASKDAHYATKTGAQRNADETESDLPPQGVGSTGTSASRWSWLKGLFR